MVYVVVHIYLIEWLVGPLWREINGIFRTSLTAVEKPPPSIKILAEPSL
jgi:hypothetical protein